MKLFYAETGVSCCIVADRDADRARRQVLREVGTHAGVGAVHEATEDEIAWVAAMGGHVPEVKSRVNKSEGKGSQSRTTLAKTFQRAAVKPGAV